MIKTKLFPVNYESGKIDNRNKAFLEENNVELIDVKFLDTRDRLEVLLIYRV